MTNSAPTSKPPLKRYRTILGIRYATLLELGLGLSLPLVFDALFLDGTRFRSTPQHPFWIPVLLLAVQYGTGAGVLAAIVSSIALLAGNLPPQAVFEDRFTWFFEVGRLPLLWFIVALVLGELRRRQLEERERLRQELEEACRREDIVADAYRRLREAKEALETRVAGQLRTALALYEAARGLEKLEPSEVLLGVNKLVHSVMNPEKFSLYLLRNENLELVLEEGWDETDNLPRVYDPSSRLFQEIVGRQRIISVVNPDDEILLSNAGMLAAPLVVPATGRVAGMLKIEKLAFLELNFSNVQTFRVLSQWIGAAYENALRYQEARAEAVVNYDTELFSYGFLSRQITMLEMLAERIGFDVSMILVRLENPGNLNAAQLTQVPLAFSRTVRQVLRRSDLAFDYQRAGAEFALVLPATAIDGARVVVHKIEEALYAELAEDAPQAHFCFGVQSIHDSRGVEQADLELQSV
ncbi:MAG: GAF domain-containing protein [Acidobacteriia bacterium]|nr:GAF domain-containing protein [Terriglobia bacterium]